MKTASIVKKYSSDLRVLYVEDDESLRNESYEIFKLLFKEVKVAVDGEDGLNHYRFDGEFDLVITDIYMPKLNGVEMAREIKSINPAQPIVVISAHDDSNYLLDLINIGISHFILKPVETGKMLGVLLKVSKEIYNEKELDRFHEYLKERVDEEFNRRKESETLLIQQSKMAALGQMLGAITHQWSQPLNVIPILLHELIELSKEGAITQSDIEQFSENIMRQIEYMSQTVRDFKSFLKPSRDKERFMAKKAISSVHQIMKEVFDSKGIVVNIESSDREVYGFENEFKQAVLNIFANMIDAIEEKRQLGIPDYRGIVAVQFKERDGKLIITISDNGSGISPSMVDKIFEPYFSTKKEKGTGIGLHIAKIVIEQSMNGSIKAIASSDGAIFEIELAS